MRIKFNDKIYRLKEIESGVDSLMELVEEPKYNHGDFLMTPGRLAFIFDREGKNGEAHYLFATDMDGVLCDDIQERGTGARYCGYLKNAVLADQEAIKIIHDKLKSMGKFWNAEKKCIEDIPAYRSGDILVKEYKTGSKYIFILDRISEDNTIHYHCYHSPTYHSTGVKPDFGIGSVGDIYHKCLRYAEDSEKELLFAELAEIGKRWNDEKKCIEDIPVYKDGDFVYEDGRIMIIKSYPKMYHALIYPKIDLKVSYNKSYALTTFLSELSFRVATQEEKQLLIDAMAKDGKCWNNDKKCVEDIPKPKFKAGDKVRIKDGISSETHRYASPNFTEPMDEFIGKELTVKEYSNDGFVVFNVDYLKYHFHENWLEPWSDEPKVGDMVIAWNNDMSLAVIGVKINATPMQACKHVLNNNNSYKYAVKFNGTRDHLEKIRSGKV